MKKEIALCLTHIVLCFCFDLLRLVCPVLSVSLDCPYLIGPSVFSNVYFIALIQLTQPHMYDFSKICPPFPTVPIIVPLVP